MKQFYKFTTLLIALCFTITGCFGNKSYSTQNQTSNIQTRYADNEKSNYINSNNFDRLPNYKKRGIRTECKCNQTNIATACEMYAADYDGKYPKDLDIIKNKNYMKELPKCPIDGTEYKYISKESPSYYIIKCQSPKHKLMFDSYIGRINLDENDVNSINHYKKIMSGTIESDYGTIKFTPEEIKELELKE